jgi:hypothetical protein
VSKQKPRSSWQHFVLFLWLLRDLKVIPEVDTTLYDFKYEDFTGFLRRLSSK